MKIRKSLFSLVGAMLVTFGFTACTDWGDQDPAAGNQVYPERQVVNTYDFEYSDDKPEFSDMVIHNEVCEVVNDDYLGSNVLHLNGTGAAKIANPFNNVKLQNGAAITFAVKVDCAEGEEMDLKRPIFSFGSDDAQGARFYFTPNGQLVYTKPGQLQSLDLDENDPDTYKTGILTPNEWHFVALQLGQKGYQLYVDGKKSLSGYQPEGAAATTFSYQTLLDSIQALPYLYIGTTGDELGTAEYGSLSVDNVTLIRNQMNERDWNKTVGGNGGGGSDEQKVYVPVGLEDCSTAWWSAFSDYFTIPANQTFHTKFINHTKGDLNYHNWLLIVCNDRERGGDGYSEYFVLRSDLWGWGNADYNAANLTNEGYGDWDDFKRNMEGAEVDMTVEHRGGEVYVTAIATCKDGTVYKEMYHQPCDANDNIRAFLTCEGSYLQIDAAETYIGEEYAAGSKLVGPADCTAGWWTAFSDFYPLNSTITGLSIRHQVCQQQHWQW